MNRTVRELMGQKDLSCFSALAPNSTLRDAIHEMARFDSTAALVTDLGNVKGIISERDFIRAMLSSQGGPKLTDPVSRLMSQKVAYVTPEYTLEECLIVMSQIKVRHLPVLEMKRPVALLSMSQITEALIADKEYMIGELEKYINGNHFKFESKFNYVRARELNVR